MISSVRGLSEIESPAEVLHRLLLRNNNAGGLTLTGHGRNANVLRAVRVETQNIRVVRHEGILFRKLESIL